MLAGMDTYRTPDDRFADLPDFDYAPSYVEVTNPDAAAGEAAGTLRMAYVEAGPADGPVALLLHGEPTWSFLYRHVMRVLADAGIRSIAPDLIGFGRSDKPLATTDHTYARHLEWLRELAFDHLDLTEVTLVGQDWGGLLGLRLVAENPDRFARVVAANTGLPTGDFDMPEIWWMFHNAVQEAETLDIGRFVAAGCTRGLSDPDRRAYDAPFPEESAKAGPRVMPTLVPTSTQDPATKANRAAWEVLSTWEKPFLTPFSDGDPITGAMAPIMRKMIPGAAGLEHPTVENAGHFLQEDAGDELGRIVADFIKP